MTKSADPKHLIQTIARLERENSELRFHKQEAFAYIRQKIDQLLIITGTVPLRPEELDNDTLLQLDPIGIISDTFGQILEHLRETNSDLAEARDEIQAIFDSFGGGLLVLDQEMKIIAYNMKMDELFTDTTRGTIGRKCHELLCEEPGISPRKCVIKEIFRAKMIARKKWAHKGHNYEVVGNPVIDDEGNISKIVVLYLDVTRSVTAERALSQSEQKYRKLVEAANDAIVLLETETGIILEINKKGEELLGQPAEEIIHRHYSKLFPAGQNLVFENYFHEIIAGEKIPATNLTVSRKDGHTIPVELSSGLIELDNKVVMLSLLRDITERKRMEEELQRTQKLESIGILAGGIAHDFNNLLTAFVGNVSLAKMQTNPGDKIFARLTAAEDAASRAKDLTHQLLTFAKGGAPVTKTASVAKLIEETTGFFLRGANIKCEYSFQPDLMAVEIDEGQFSQVIHNLVINAEQAMPEGGVIRIGVENIINMTTISKLLPPGNYVKISLSDNGIGIAKDHLSKIFDPFFSTKQKGSGLGLATSHSIIQAHGGLITVDSILGKGTTFNIFLAASNKQPSPSNEKSQPIIMGSGIILVMDDEVYIQEVAKEMLKELGFKTVCASNGQEAIELYKNGLKTSHSFDAVIMDLTIPGGMGGKETIGRLLEIDPDVKAVVSSGYANDPVMANFAAYGFCGVVPKPYRLDTLNDAIRKAID